MKCPSCHGTGQIRQTMFRDCGDVVAIYDCGECDGTGQIEPATAAGEERDA